MPNPLLQQPAHANTALLVGLGALVYASFTISEASLPAYGYPSAVADKVAFARAGTMHNFSYLGGFLGIVTASLYLIVERMRQIRAAPDAKRADK